MRAFLILAATGALAAPLSAQAQSDDDWDISRDPDEDRVTASVIYSNGVGIATRCTDGSFEVLLAGLPPATGDDFTRVLTIAIGEEPAYPQTWTRGANSTVAFSQMPARFAGTLRTGGLMQITAEATGDQPGERVALEIPQSSTAVDETLTTCGRPLVDPRDAQLTWIVTNQPAPLEWARPPRPDFPDRAISGGLLRGVAVVSCLSQLDGRTRDCEVESEHPAGFDLGREARVAAGRARLQTTDGSPVPVTLVIFSVHYRMAD